MMAKRRSHGEHLIGDPRANELLCWLHEERRAFVNRCEKEGVSAGIALRVLCAYGLFSLSIAADTDLKWLREAIGYLADEGQLPEWMAEGAMIGAMKEQGSMEEWVARLSAKLEAQAAEENG